MSRFKRFTALLLACMLVIPMMTFGITMNVSANPVEGSLFAFYSFNEIVDGMIADGMGTNHGQVRGGVTIANDPERGNVLALDGASGSYVLLASGLLETLETLTITTWFRWTGPDNQSWSRVWDFGDGTSDYFMLTPRSGDGTLRFESRAGYPGYPSRWVQYDMFHDEWVHTAVTVGNGVIRLYVNGEFITDNDFTQPPSAMGHTTRNYIGNSQWPDPFFQGYIDDLAIYSTVLTEAQIREVMNHSFTTPADVLENIEPPPPPPARPIVDTTPNADGMFLRYTFNEIIDDMVIDDINGNHGEVINGATIVNDPDRGPVLFLDGTNQHIRMPNNITAGLNALTVSAWYRWTDINDRHWSRLIDIGSGTHSYIFISPRSGYHETILFETNSDDTPVERLVGPFAMFDEWVHVAGTIHNGRAYFYVNGELADERDVEFIPSFLGESTQNWIGRSQFAADAFFTGYIDDVIFFNRALSQAEIQTLMNEDFSDIRGMATVTPTVDPVDDAPQAADTAPPVEQAPPTPAPATADPITLIAAAAFVSAAGAMIAKGAKRRK